MYKKNIIITLGTCLFSIGAHGFDSDQTALINEYNAKYEELLTKQVTWPTIQQESLSKVSEATEGYDNAVFQVQELEQSIEYLRQDLETQRQHLAFLKQIETVSTRIKNTVKRDAVQAGYFSAVSQVNAGSLNAKALEFQDEIDTLNANIAEKQREIEDLRASSEFQTLISQRNQFRRSLSSTESSISTKNAQIRNLDFSITNLNSQINRSKELENDYKIEAIEIRTRRVPRLQSDELRLQTRLTQQQTELSIATGNRDALTEEIRGLNRRIANLEEQLAADPENANLQRRLNNRRGERREKRQARNALNNQIGQIESEVSNTNRRLNRVQRDINDLLQLALRRDRQSGDEAIKQIRLNSELDQSERGLASARQELSRLESTKVRLQGQVAQSQSQINAFVQNNIRPIENQIAGLEREKSNVTGQRNQVSTWSNRLQREDANIAQAPELISAQESTVQESELSLSNSEQGVAAANQAVEALRKVLSEAISEYNSNVEALASVQNELKDLEEKMKTELSGERND